MSNSGAEMLKLYEESPNVVNFGGIEISKRNMSKVELDGHVLKFYYAIGQTNWIIDFDNLAFISGR